MRLIIDANILFAALIKDSLTAHILVNDKLKFYAPEFLFEEFTKYEDYLLDKTHRTKKDFKKFYKILRQKITIIPKKDIETFLKQAMEISPDPKDTIYLALSLATDSKMWSNDKVLKNKQNLIEILTTEEILDEVTILEAKKEQKNDNEITE